MMARCEECKELFAVRGIQEARKNHIVEVMQGPGTDTLKRAYWLKKMLLCSQCLKGEGVKD